MEKNSLVYSSVPSQLNHKIKSSWVKHYSNHENHEDISPRKFPAIQYFSIIYEIKIYTLQITISQTIFPLYIIMPYQSMSFILFLVNLSRKC